VVHRDVGGAVFVLNAGASTASASEEVNYQLLTEIQRKGMGAAICHG
jgi:hypothetical protein